MPAKRFSPAAAKKIHETGYFYIRAGDDHRFIAIWVVVINGRVFVRPWNDRATGWYRAFLENPIGAVKVGEKEVRVRARKVRSATLINAVDDAYAAKYTSKANQPYVKGFATAKRKATTTELTPA